jgi:signal transduction histidine kinase/CheY-like chemotaxis protein
MTVSQSVKEQVKKAIDAIYLGQLRLILLAIFGYDVLVTISHYFFVAEDVRFPLMLFSGLTALVASISYFLVRRNYIKASLSHVTFIPSGILGLLSTYLHVLLTGDQIQLTNGVLMMLAFGFLTLSPVIFAGLFLLCTGLYIAVLMLVPGDYVIHLAFMYGTASVPVILSSVLRYRSLVSMQYLLISNRKKTTELEVISVKMQEKMREAEVAAAAADKANRAKGDFLANATHELKTPLTGVLGMMDILSETRLDGEQKEAVEAARFSAETLLVVVNDLLDLARLDTGKFELEALPFSPISVVSHVTDLLRPSAFAKGLSLVVYGTDGKDMPLIGDPIRVGQILLNFLDNAIKFTQDGSVAVTVSLTPVVDRCREEVESGELITLKFQVKDTGPGFEPEDWAKLFGRFTQLDDSSASAADGVGLGLSICQGLCEHMGGNIAVHSEPGAGAEFIFSVQLPVAQDIGSIDLGVVSRPASLRNALRPKLLVPNTKEWDQVTVAEAMPRLLLAEDNKINQLLISKLAIKFGWQLDIAGDGEQAVKKMETEPPYDLILMDIRMPGVDGIEATRVIKGMPDGIGSIPIIALTANTSEDDATLYKQEGMAAIVGKPVNAVELKLAVENALASRK